MDDYDYEKNCVVAQQCSEPYYNIDQQSITYTTNNNAYKGRRAQATIQVQEEKELQQCSDKRRIDAMITISSRADGGVH